MILPSRESWWEIAFPPDSSVGLMTETYRCETHLQWHLTIQPHIRKGVSRCLSKILHPQRFIYNMYIYIYIYAYWIYPPTQDTIVANKVLHTIPEPLNMYEFWWWRLHPWLRGGGRSLVYSSLPSRWRSSICLAAFWSMPAVKMWQWTVTWRWKIRLLILHPLQF